MANRKNRTVRWAARGILGLLLLFVVLLLFIRSPWGQNIIVNRVVDYISGKTNTEVAIERLFIDFSGNFVLEGLYLEDKQGDTLLYSKTLKARLGIAPLLLENELDLESVQWDRLRANISRPDDSLEFNFEFLLKALSPLDTTANTSNSDPFTFSLGSAELSDFVILYDDGFSGITSTIRLGELNLDMRTTDLEATLFEIANIDVSKSNISFVQNKPSREPDAATAQLPILRIDQLNLNKVIVHYHSVPDSVKANFNIGEFILEQGEAKLPMNELTVDRFALKNSGVRLQLPGQDAEIRDSNAPPPAKVPFSWPAYNILARTIELENNTVHYRAGDAPPRQGGFNPDDFGLSALAMHASDLAYRPEHGSLNLNRLSFLEVGGFRLTNMSFDASLDATSARLSEIDIQTDSSHVEGSIALGFDSFQELLEAPEKARVQLRFPDIELALQEAFTLLPGLAQNEALRKASGKPVHASLDAEGSLGDISLNSVRIAWGDSTSLSVRGRIMNVTNMDSMRFVLNDIRIATGSNDVRYFVDEEVLGIAIPRTIRASGELSGRADSLNADIHLHTSSGKLLVTGSFQTRDEIRIRGTAVADSLMLDKLLHNNRLGPLGFTMDFWAIGKDMGTLDADIVADFTQLEFDNYDFSKLELRANMVDGRGNARLRFEDENLNLLAKTEVYLDSLHPIVNLDLEVIGANLQALGLTKEDIRVALDLRADYVGSTSDYTLNGHLLNGVAVYDNNQYQTGDLRFSSEIDSVRTDITIDSDFLKGELKSNSSPKGIQMALRKQFRNYFGEVSDSISNADTVKLAMHFKLTPTPVLTEVFFREIDRLDSIVFQAEYDASAQNITAALDVPSAEYKGSVVDSLHIRLNGSATDLSFNAGIQAMRAGPVQMKKTVLTGNLRNRELLLDLNSSDGQEDIMHIASGLKVAGDSIFLHVRPDSLILNSKTWAIQENNLISISSGRLAFENFELSRNGQRLRVGHAFPGVDGEHLGISFENFRLQALLSLLNPDEALAAGSVNGELIIEDPFGAPGMVANFGIADFQLMQHPLGNLSFNGTSEGGSGYGFDLVLEDGGAELELEGAYTASESGALLNLDLAINRLELAMIEAFSNAEIKESQGYLSGKIAVSGTTVSPEYQGTLNFHEAGFTVARLNAGFQISGEYLDIDTDGITLRDFEISDENGSTLTMDGSVLTQELLNPFFDLNIHAENFQVLNSTEEDNKLFYGNASLDADLTLKGDLNIPRIEGSLGFGEQTDITYAVPENQMEVQEREGVVIFVNRENPDAILTRSDQEEAFVMKGVDVRAVLAIAEDAKFRIIIDRRSGDNLMVSGNAALNLNIEPNGRINLSGRYDLQSGHYETSLYNLVNRRFEINPGSTITWQGDPMDAKLDVTASYSVEASAAPLMASVTSGQGSIAAGQYRQVLPFLVYLNVDGALLEPEISFDLDMPEAEQGSLGGAVYSRVQQLNQQEAELNKQVFSLLALNRFYPDSGSDGSAGGTAAIARDNVNKVLSGELNAFSEQVFGDSGFEVDFDFDSFTDYQGETPQDRTQLNINAKKKLFDDRLIVTAGSAVDVEGSATPGQEETPIIGNVSLEYLLTENGRFRLRGFRKSEYENIIDGQLIITGVALIFNREFNEFSELFNPLKEEEDKDDKEKTEENNQ